MVLNPNREEDVKQSIEDRVKGRIERLTNFVSGSFNKLFLDTFAEQLYEYEVRLLAAQLSGWVDYAGGPITQNDLDRLGLDEFDDLELLNSYMKDRHLDNIGSLVGISRSDGETSTGQIEVEVFDSSTRVPDGMEVATAPDVDGTQFSYFVDIDSNYVTPADQGNSDFVVVDIVAEEPGSEYNVGSGAISRLPSPPPGIESVSNPSSTTGGTDAETNEELRSRIKNAVFETSGGGTVQGIRGFIINNVDGVNDVFVDEFLTAQPVYVDVIVDGGVTSDVEDAIETSRPAGIEHNLVRPVTYNIAIDVELRGEDIEQLDIRDEIENYIFSLDLGDDFVEDRLVQRILNADEEIQNILAINTRVVDIQNYKFQFNSGTNVYALPESPLGQIEDEAHLYEINNPIYRLGTQPIDGGSAVVEAEVGGATQTVSDTEYDIVDDDGDGMLDSIDWSPGSTTPDGDTIFTVTYDTKDTASETFSYDGSDTYSLTYIPALPGDSTVTDAGNDTYTLGTDYDIVDNDGDGDPDTLKWLSGGSTPNNSENFTVDYEVGVGSIEDVTGTLNGTSGHDFVEGTDFDELDDDADTYVDAIDWSLAGDDPDDTTDVTIDLSVETDVAEDYMVSAREKISPVVDEISVVAYE